MLSLLFLPYHFPFIFSFCQESQFFHHFKAFLLSYYSCTGSTSWHSQKCLPYIVKFTPMSIKKKSILHPLFPIPFQQPCNLVSVFISCWNCLW
jgi:hypothetical protein